MDKWNTDLPYADREHTEFHDRFVKWLCENSDWVPATREEDLKEHIDVWFLNKIPFDVKCHVICDDKHGNKELEWLDDGQVERLIRSYLVRQKPERHNTQNKLFVIFTNENDLTFKLKYGQISINDNFSYVHPVHGKNIIKHITLMVM